MLANGDTIEELLKEYPSLKREDILACIEYAQNQINYDGQYDMMKKSYVFMLSDIDRKQHEHN